ncbi:toxin-antitoxin system YwqK family antitoxin [Vibrio owensii]|uniref:toxin-antitoxin system YwqK family antitoxin n=1 Tax=Vibrio owensii TaxID=696485 RepID=UPI0038CD256A
MFTVTPREKIVKNYFRTTLLILGMLLCSTAIADSYKKGETFYDLNTDKRYSGTVVGYSQDVDERGLGTSYQVDHKSYFDYTLEVRDGVRDGTSKLYKKYLRVINGKTDKVVERYLHTEVRFSNGKLLWAKGFREDGSIKSITKLNDGVGERFSKDGLLESRFSYVTRGEFPSRQTLEVFKDFLGNPFAMHGELSTFYKDGSVRRKYLYRMNLKHGNFVSYHENGNVFQKGNYTQGKMDGEYILKCEDGRLAKHLEYLMGDVVKTHVDKGSNFCYE